MKKSILIVVAMFISSLLIYSCGGGTGSENKDNSSAGTTSTANPDYDPNRGVGRFTTVDVGDHLDAAMAAEGKKVFDVKCSSCHKLTEEKLVGPGYKGVTDRRTPEWIMNFVTNTEEMIAKDTAAQNMLEVCLVKMPNQSLAETDARAVLEFFRKNDGKQ